MTVELRSTAGAKFFSVILAKEESEELKERFVEFEKMDLFKWKRVQLVGLSERGCRRRRKKTSKPGSVLHRAKNSTLLVFSVFAVRTARFYLK